MDMHCKWAPALKIFSVAIEFQQWSNVAIAEPFLELIDMVVPGTEVNAYSLLTFQNCPNCCSQDTLKPHTLLVDKLSAESIIVIELFACMSI